MTDDLRLIYHPAPSPDENGQVLVPEPIALGTDVPRGLAFIRRRLGIPAGLSVPVRFSIEVLHSVAESIGRPAVEPFRARVEEASPALSEESEAAEFTIGDDPFATFEEAATFSDPAALAEPVEVSQPPRSFAPPPPPPVRPPPTPRPAAGGGAPKGADDSPFDGLFEE